VRGDATVATDAAFQLGGRDVETPRVTFWESLLNIIARVFTLGQVGFTRSIDEGHFHDAGAEFAMAGGQPLRDELKRLGPAEATRQIAQMVRQANPDITEREAQHVAQAIHAGAQQVYAMPGMTRERLDGLQSAYNAAGPEAFGGKPGHWLLSHSGVTSPTLAQDLAAAGSPAEVRAALELGLPQFASFDAESQVRLAQQVFAVRDSTDASAAFSGLMSDASFAALAPPSVRRDLLSAVAAANNSPGLARLADRPEVQRAASAAFLGAGALPDAATRDAALTSLSELVSDLQFLALPEALQRRVLSTIGAGHSDAGLVDDVRAMIATPAFSALATGDVATAQASLQARRARHHKHCAHAQPGLPTRYPPRDRP